MIIELVYFVLFVVLVNLITGFKRQSILGCGLVGFSGANGQSFSIPVVKLMLWYNSLTRGEHATGIYAPSMGVIKEAKKAVEFFKNEEKMSLLEENDSYLLGHVRHATVGNTTDPQSAHPWDFGDIAMMHNGTLKNHENLATKYGIKKTDWTVDSQVLGLGIQQNFKDGEPFKILSEYVGAAAVIVYHKERESLFVYRDEERPLFYGYLDDNMYMTSLREVLEGAGCTNIKSFEPYRVHEIKDGCIISKMVIKRMKATKNNIMTKVVKHISSIVSYFQYNIEKLFLTEDFSGFQRNCLKAKYFENYHVRAKITTSENSNFGRITKGNYYKMVTAIDERTFTIRDDKSTVQQVVVDLFEYESFIPTAGSYVVALQNTNGLKQGEMYECLYHRFGFETIIVKDHFNDKNIYDTIGKFRTASKEEIAEYFKDCNTCTVIHLPAKTQTSMEFDEGNKGKSSETTEGNYPQVIEVVEEPIVEEEDPVSTDELTAILVENFLLSWELLSEEIGSIMKEYGNQMSDGLEERMNFIAMVAGECSSADFKFVLNLNENSFNNLELID